MVPVEKLNKIIAIQISEHINCIMLHSCVGFNWATQDVPTYANEPVSIKGNIKLCHNINELHKAFDKPQHVFMIQTQSGHRWDLPECKKGHIL